MSQTPPDSLLQFPCEFPLKVFGRDTAEFTEFVYTTVSRHAPGLARSALSRHASRKGSYVAITVTLQAESRAQLDGIYRELSASELVLMTL